MAQKNIDFGSFPDDPSADAIRTAFQKTQENFSELFQASEAGQVLSVNKTAGAGITVNTPTGNVVVSANIACVRIQTSTLGLGVSAGNSLNDVVIVTGSTPFIIDIPETVNNVANINLSDTLTANTVNVNLQINGNVGNFSGNITGANLNTTGVLSVSGNANVGNIGGGNAIFTANANAINFNGTNVNVSGNINATSGYVNAQTGNFSGNINAANANLGNLATANFFSGDGYLLTNVTATVTKIVNGTSEANIVSSGGNLAISIGGNSNVQVVSASGVEITGTLGATGNANVGNLGAVSVLLTGNANAVNFNGTNVNVTGNLNATSGYVNAQTGNFSGNINAANANLGNLVTANFFSGDGGLLSNLSVAAGSYIQNGTSNVNIATSGGNVTVSVAGNTNILTVTGTGANISGTANVTGNLDAGNVAATYITGTITTTSNAQPNITSLGTLTGLTVNGISNLGPASNLLISGGTNQQVLTSNGAGGVSFVTATALTFAPGANTEVLFNDATSFGASAGLTFDKTSNTLSANGNILGTNVYANSGTIGASLLKGTLVAASNSQPNITDVGSLSNLIVLGNVNTNNLSVTNYANSKFLTVVSGSIAANTPALHANQIWNNSSVVFKGINFDATDTASDAGSMLLDLSVGTVSKFSVTKAGNVTGAYFLGNGSQLTGLPGGDSISNGTSNVSFSGVNGNVNLVSAGNTTLVVTGTGANITGTANVTGNANVGNLGTGTAVITTGNITTINSGLMQNGNSNIVINANANIRMSVRGNADVVTLSSTTMKLDVSSYATYASYEAWGSSGGLYKVMANKSGMTDVLWMWSTNSNTYIETLFSDIPVNILVGSAERMVVANTYTTMSVHGAGNVVVINNTGANITGNLVVSSNANITGNANTGNLGTTTAVVTTGNITTINSGLMQNGNSNIAIATNANITLTAKSNATMVISDTGANVTGTFNATGNATIGGKLTLAGSTSSLAALLTNASEIATISATAATGTINYDITTQSILYYTSNASANWTVNFRASSGTTLDAALGNSQSVTCVFAVSQGPTPYFANVHQIDGSTANVTVKWQGGVAPTAGNANGVDVYTYSIIKTATTPAYTILASQVQFA